MAFLRFEPFSIKCYWQSLVIRWLAHGGKGGALTFSDVSNNSELLPKKLFAMLQDGEDFGSPICISTLTGIVITCCAHILCRSCILTTIQHTKAFGPLCHCPLTQSHLFSAPSNSYDAENTKISSSRNTKSSKVFSLLTLLLVSRD